MDAEDERSWAEYCHRMAEATYFIAERCDDPRMIGAYLDLAGQWLRMAAKPPASGWRRAAGPLH